MSATQPVAGRTTGRFLAAILLVVALGMGLASCRGFFGQAPIALLTFTTGGDTEAPITVTFDLSGSNDPDGAIVTFEINFGDGSTNATGTDVSVPVAHEYDQGGIFTVVLTVTDNDGRIGMVNAVVTIGPAMLTFASDRVSDFDIYRMQADGTNQGTIYNSTVDELFPDLVRETRDKIAYAAEDGIASWDIWTMTVTGTSRTQLTTQTDSNQIQPSWSADANMIAYASNGTVQTPSADSWEIFTMTAAGTTQTQRTTQTPSSAIAPAFSPVDDDVFLFVSCDSPTDSAIWKWDLSTGTGSELYDSAGARDGDASPALAGLGVALNLPAGAGISRPAWSPDGTKIAFSTNQGISGGVDIYVMDADGTGAETLEAYVNSLLTTPVGAGSITPTGATEHEFCPYWLEDGSGIAFAKDTGVGGTQLHVVSFDTGAVTKLTETGSNVSPAAKP